MRVLRFSGRRIPGSRAGFAACALAVFLFGGCLDEEGEDDCETTPLFCERQPPSSATLTIRTGGGAVQSVEVYAGNAYETGRLVWTGVSGTTIRLPLGPYSAKATYLVGNKMVIAVDGDELSYSSTSYCTADCYDEVGGEVDLRLED